MQGTIIEDRYKIVEELGKGGMGVVYRAVDTRLQREVAVKILDTSRLGSEGRQRMVREAQVVAKLNHPNIVMVFDAGEYQEKPFIVMELVEGGNLHEKPPQGLDEILKVVRQVCLALDHAHSQQVIHRDLKPENIVRDGSGNFKLMDFGLARSVASRLTEEGSITGTVFYIPPEQAMGQEVDARSDLYSLGVMMYEWTAGKLPFHAEDPVAVITQHLHAPVVPPKAAAEELPSYINDLILALLSKTPEDRPGSAQEVIARLDAKQEDKKAAGTHIKEFTVLDRITRGRFVGRKSELEAARALWRTACGGKPQLLLVTGEPGIGKTRFTQEIITQAEISGGQVFQGASYSRGNALYGAFRPMIRKALRHAKANQIQLPERALAQLLILAPDLRDSYPEISVEAGIDLEEDQQSFFEHMAVVVNIFCGLGPVLIVLEDIHWADSGTLNLFLYLARVSRDQALMFAVTYREIEVHENRAFHQVLLDLNRERLGERFKLSRLEKIETNQMLEALFGEEVSEEMTEGIYRETEGNPFFTEEVCKALVDSGQVYFKDGEWHRPDMDELGIPQSVHVAVQSRVDQLAEEEQKLLRLAAVFGRQFSYEILRRASGLDEDALVDALESAERAQLIEEYKDGKDELAFVFMHALIPTTLVEDTRTLERRRLHKKAAEAIELLDPGDITSLAYHFNEAGETEKAVEYMIRVGDAARQIYAVQEAIENYSQVIESLKELGDYQRAGRTMMKLALTYQNALDHNSSSRAFEEAFALLKQAESHPAEDLKPASRPFRTYLYEPGQNELDPAKNMTTFGAYMIKHIYSNLVRLLPDGSVIPDAAHSWEILEGGTRYIFNLRKDVLWSDGITVTAHDFVFAVHRILDSSTRSQGASILFMIKNAEQYHRGEIKDAALLGIRAVDEYTLEMELKEPAAYFMQLLAHCTFSPVPAHKVEELGEQWANPDKIVTNGPFLIQEWKHGKHIHLKKNPSYPGRFTGNLENVEIGVDPGEDLLKSYREDRLDFLEMFFASAGTSERGKRLYPAELTSRYGLMTAFLNLNSSLSPLDDVKVRQAIVQSIDWENSHGGLVESGLIPTGGLIPPGLPGHTLDLRLPYDPVQARKLLAEAGYSSKNKFPKLKGTYYTGPHVRIDQWCTAFADQLLEILGIEIDWEIDGFYDYINQGKDKFRENHFAFWGWQVDYPDPDSMLRSNPWFEHVRDSLSPEFVSLVNQAAQISDPLERLHLYQRADRILIGENYVIPAIYAMSPALVKPWVKKAPMQLGLILVDLYDVVMEGEPE